MRTSLVMLFVLGTASVALAQTPAPEPAGMPPPSYESPQRAACEAELAKDARWFAEQKQTFIREFHEEEARVVTNNNRHVVLAYGALWVLTAGFLGLMFLRQRKLDAEIARL